jgi:RimJ/RimL family protein N-acetyltransferase
MMSGFPQVPVLHTARLTLRAFGHDDFPWYLALLRDPEVMRHLGDGRPLGEIEAWRHLAQVVGHWVLRGYGLWAVEETASGRLVGRIGLLEPQGWPGLEVAYTVERASWGRGYAREGARAALDYAHRTLNRPDVISVIRPANAASIRVATSLGAARSHAIDFFGAPADVYRYPSPSAQAPTG